MGLAPYGRPTYVKQIREIIEDGPRGQFRLNPRYYPFLQTDRMFFNSLPELLSNPPPTPEWEIAQFHMDVARSAQVVLDEVLLSKVRYLHFVAGLFSWAFSPRTLIRAPPRLAVPSLPVCVDAGTRPCPRAARNAHPGAGHERVGGRLKHLNDSEH
jgi:hypothetical protein